uniref:HECT-type E3 ubiquitin transferase n=1 Tax=Mesocestoides corti TaxID=53468 RepID=A0A5K3FRU8_MESCO
MTPTKMCRKKGMRSVKQPIGTYWYTGTIRMVHEAA